MQYSSSAVLGGAIALAATASFQIPREATEQVVVDFPRAESVTPVGIPQHTVGALPSPLTHPRGSVPALPASDTVVIGMAEEIFDVSRCELACGDNVFAWSMFPYFSQDQPRALGLVYNSRQAFVAPIVVVDATPGTNLAVPDRLSMRLIINGSAVAHLDGGGATEVFFNQDQRKANRLAFQFDGNAFATGVYSYQAEVRFWRGGSDTTYTVNGRIMIVRRDSTRLGAGWAFAGLQQIKVIGNDSIFVWDGDGSATYFVKDSPVYKPPLGEHSRMTKSGTTYTRRYRDGTRINFDSASGRMQSIVDLYDQTTSLTWSGDTLKTIRDPVGLPIKLDYLGGRLFSITDSVATRSYNFLYNSAGELTDIQNNQDNGTIVFSYATSAGQRHLVTGVTNELGKTTNFSYDFTRKLASTQLPAIVTPASAGTGIRPDLKTETWTRINVADFSQSIGTSSTPRNWWGPETTGTTVILPEGGKFGWSNDRFGWATALYTTDGSRYALFDRDSKGQITQTKNFQHHYMQFQYDTMGNVTRVTNTHTLRADTISYATTTIDGFVVTLGVARVGNNAQAPNIARTYIGKVEVRTQIGPDALTTFRDTLTSDGRLADHYDPAGHKTHFTYESSGKRNLTEITRGTLVTSFVRDVAGRDSIVTKPEGVRDTLLYDTRNRLTRVTAPLGQRVIYVYDYLNLIQVRDTLGQTYDFKYNAAGWDTAHVDAGLRTQHFLYNRNGQLGKWTNRRGNITTFAYDTFSRLTRRVAGTDTATYSYDITDAILVASNSASLDTIYAGKMMLPDSTSTKRNGVLFRTKFAYDSVPRRRHAIITSGASVDTVRWRYRANGMVDSIIDAGGRKTAFQSNNDLVPTGAVYPGPFNLTLTNTSLHHTAGISYNYSPVNTVAGRHITFDAAGRVIQVWHANQDTMRLIEYDSAGRLKKVTLTAVVVPPEGCSYEETSGYNCYTLDTTVVRTFVYNYDRVGNFVGPVDPGNRLTIDTTDFRIGTVNIVDILVYDAVGNVTQRRSRPQNGVAVTQDFTWNALSQLQSVLTYNNDTPHNTGSMRYDAWGRRIWHSSLADTIHFIWDGDVVLAEADDVLTIKQVFAYPPGSLKPHAVTRGDSTYYYLYDEAGNVTMFLRQDFVVHNDYRQGPWGAGGTNSTMVPNVINFQGQYINGEAGIYYFRARWYDPRTRRFLSEDPIGLAGGINQFSYAGNDPINRSDPLGLQPCDPTCEPLVVTVERCPEHFRTVLCPSWERGGGRSSRGGTDVPSLAGMSGGGSGHQVPSLPAAGATQDCRGWGRFRENVSTTNRFFFGDITRFTRSGLGFLTAGATAKSFGGVTFSELVRTLPKGYPALGGLAGTASAFAINSAINAVFVGTAIEAGILIGSALDALNCEYRGEE